MALPLRQESRFVVIEDRLDEISHKLDRALADRSKVTDMWLSKKQLAQELGVGVRWIESRKAEGMPSRMIAGKIVFRLGSVERWLRHNGYLEGE